MATSSARRGVLLFGLPVLALLVAAVWWFSRAEPSVAASAITADAPQAVRVRTVLAQVRDVPIRVRGVGTVQAWQTVTVRAQIQGQLKSVHFQEGEQVQAGQLIAQLDDGAQQAQLAQAKAQLARDQAQLENARLDLTRYNALAQRAAIDRQTLDTQRAQVAALQATVKSDQAQVQAAQVQLGYTRITAPLTGRTGVLQIDPGNVVHPTDAQGIVTINQLDPIAVRFTVPDTAFSEVLKAWTVPAAAGGAAPPAPDLRVQVYAQGRDERLGEGRLTLVDNQIDVTSATLRLKARLDNGGLTLWPGQTVDVQLVLGDRPDALVVPDAAVQRGAQGLFVYTVQDDDHVRVQPVTVAASQDGWSVIGTGLQPGVRVVEDGQYKLRPGVLVSEEQVTSAQVASPTAAPTS